MDYKQFVGFLTISTHFKHWDDLNFMKARVLNTNLDITINDIKWSHEETEKGYIIKAAIPKKDIVYRQFFEVYKRY